MRHRLHAESFHSAACIWPRGLPQCPIRFYKFFVLHSLQSNAGPSKRTPRNAVFYCPLSGLASEREGERGRYCVLGILFREDIPIGTRPCIEQCLLHRQCTSIKFKIWFPCPLRHCCIHVRLPFRSGHVHFCTGAGDWLFWPSRGFFNDCMTCSTSRYIRDVIG